jgi:hypothetical protein
MNTSNDKQALELSLEELAQLGNGALSYIREIEGRDVIRMVGPQAHIAPDAKLFCLFNATAHRFPFLEREAAVGSAVEHELIRSACVKMPFPRPRQWNEEEIKPPKRSRSS